MAYPTAVIDVCMRGIIHASAWKRVLVTDGAPVATTVMWTVIEPMAGWQRGAWGSAGGGAGFAAGAGEATGGGWGEKHWQRASSKAGAGSERWSQQAAITVVAITAAARGVAQAMAQALEWGQKKQWGEGGGRRIVSG